MTEVKSTGASSNKMISNWTDINWKKVQSHVFRLQLRIAKAEREGRRGKVKALQRILTHSFRAKCMSVKRVTSSQGKDTPGIDAETWKTLLQKKEAIFNLKRRGYKPNPLRRIYIPKKSDPIDKRPLSIPCMIDRAQQALYLLSIDPLVEEWADPNAYGFRLKRSTHDAIQQCFVVLSKKSSAQWILEGDIRKCFDTINHKWLIDNIPMDKIILEKFLKSGFVENGKLFQTNEGCPQGGVISPALTVMTLSGIEKKVVPSNRHQKEREKINMVFYADDFIVTAENKEILTERIIPIIEDALKQVGLELSKTKTKITSIHDGFNFLGFNVRKYKCGKLLIKPSKENIKRFLKEIKTVIKKGVALPTDKLIHTINSRLTGWANYYKAFVSSQAFSMIDNQIYRALMKMLKKRHSIKGIPWIVRKYFTSFKGDNWRFHCMVKGKEGKQKPLFLKKMTDTKIRRHIKIKSDANPFDPMFKMYFKQRQEMRNRLKLIENDERSTGMRIPQPY